MRGILKPNQTFLVQMKFRGFIFTESVDYIESCSARGILKCSSLSSKLLKFKYFHFYHAWLNMLEYSLWDCVLNIYNIYMDVLLHGYIEDLEGGKREMGGGCRSEGNHIFSVDFESRGIWSFVQSSTDPGETSEVHKFSFLSLMT